MNTIEMLKELVENGGMFHYGDPISIYLKRDERGGICWFEKDTDKCVSSLKLNSDNMATTWKPYVKPVDWSNVPIDTPVKCRFNGCVYKRHYAGLHCGHPSVWDSGLTSHSTFDKRIAYEWDSVELADATE